MQLNTAFLLMAQYDGKAVIPLEVVRRDFFAHLTKDKLLRKRATEEIALPETTGSNYHGVADAAVFKLREEKYPTERMRQILDRGGIGKPTSVYAE